MKVVFLDHFTLNADGMDIGILHQLGDVDLYERTDPEDVIQRCHQADIIISNKVKINDNHFKNLENLKYIVVAATGFNNIDIEAAAKRGIPVSNVKGYSTECVVQHTFALMLALLNKVEHYGNQVRGGEWQRCPDFAYYNHSINELFGKTLGIIGYGTIGKRVGEVATAFGMQVLAFSRSIKKVDHPNHMIVDLEKIFTLSDIITCHAPLNDDSRHMINQQSLKMMKPTCLLINTARGGLINDKDLAHALNNYEIAGAGIDTLTEEPPGDNPLIGAENCIITPHQAWTSVEARMKLLDGIYHNILGFQAGNPMNVVNGL